MRQAGGATSQYFIVESTKRELFNTRLKTDFIDPQEKMLGHRSSVAHKDI